MLHSCAMKLHTPALPCLCLLCLREQHYKHLPRLCILSFIDYTVYSAYAYARTRIVLRVYYSVPLNIHAAKTSGTREICAGKTLGVWSCGA